MESTLMLSPLSCVCMWHMQYTVQSNIGEMNHAASVGQFVSPHEVRNSCGIQG